MGPIGSSPRAKSLSATHLIDTSALARATKPTVAAALAPLRTDNRLARCDIMELEMLYSARSPEDMMRARRSLTGYPLIEVRQADFDRAVEVMELLARAGSLRSAQPSDLLLAAIAERAGLVVLHYDKHYDMISSATRQATEWVVPRGTAD